MYKTMEYHISCLSLFMLIGCITATIVQNVKLSETVIKCMCFKKLFDYW